MLLSCTLGIKVSPMPPWLLLANGSGYSLWMRSDYASTNCTRIGIPSIFGTGHNKKVLSSSSWCNRAKSGPLLSCRRIELLSSGRKCGGWLSLRQGPFRTCSRGKPWTERGAIELGPWTSIHCIKSTRLGGFVNGSWAYRRIIWQA